MSTRFVILLLTLVITITAEPGAISFQNVQLLYGAGGGDHDFDSGFGHPAGRVQNIPGASSYQNLKKLQERGRIEEEFDVGFGHSSGRLQNIPAATSYQNLKKYENRFDVGFGYNEGSALGIGSGSEKRLKKTKKFNQGFELGDHGSSSYQYFKQFNDDFDHIQTGIKQQRVKKFDRDFGIGHGGATSYQNVRSHDSFPSSVIGGGISSGINHGATSYQNLKNFDEGFDDYYGSGGGATSHQQVKNLHTSFLRGNDGLTQHHDGATSYQHIKNQANRGVRGLHSFGAGYEGNSGLGLGVSSYQQDGYAKGYTTHISHPSPIIKQFGGGYSGGEGYAPAYNNIGHVGAGIGVGGRLGGIGGGGRHEEDFGSFGGGSGGFGGGISGIDKHYNHHPKYQFSYGVKDPHTGDDKSQWEVRDGDVVKGSYQLREPDGSLRVVDYSADAYHGFKAKVKKLGHGIHPQITEYPQQQLHHKLQHHRQPLPHPPLANPPIYHNQGSFGGPDSYHAADGLGIGGGSGGHGGGFNSYDY